MRAELRQLGLEEPTYHRRHEEVTMALELKRHRQWADSAGAGRKGESDLKACAQDPVGMSGGQEGIPLGGGAVDGSYACDCI